MHTKLMPLFTLLKGRGKTERRLIYREAAFLRGISSSPYGSEPASRLSSEDRKTLRSVHEFIGFEIHR